MDLIVVVPGTRATENRGTTVPAVWLYSVFILWAELLFHTYCTQMCVGGGTVDQPTDSCFHHVTDELKHGWFN